MKEIIIDDIDVSECAFYHDDWSCMSGDTICTLCEDNQNCYYKQLKRKEKECEELKKQYNCYACGNCKGKEDYINLEKHHKGLRKQFDKYYRALQEIEKICKEETETRMLFADKQSFCDFNKIQQIISEVEE